ncbi:hypothetical protein CALCODRAFT_553506 [Calocera cornea HHB12733]|uniref:F-box domain-containing protein n=1 Tax=Calocera cornea HHB12733 TaxID=1353952 RepID=A0A165INR9_9BASI|nr:hypothetical protein CALCODRAFT_553506 [Calocera cornea HHB12733]
MSDNNGHVHRIWHVPESVRHILSYSKAKDLVSLACTAQVFRLPALAQVWNEVDDDGILALLQIVTDSDKVMQVRWSHFEDYARLVDRLALRSFTKRTRDKLNRVVAMRPRQDRPILPQLTSLHSHPTDPRDLLCILYFMHKDLVEFHLDLPMTSEQFDTLSGNDWQEPLEAVLFRVETELPHLKRLKLILPSTDLGLISKGFFSKFAELDTFIGNEEALADDGLLELARLQSLRKLAIAASVGSSTEPSVVDLRSTPGAPCFPILEDLELAQNIDVTLGILDTMKGPLRRFNCSVAQPMSFEEAHRLVKAIASFHQTLRRLDLSMEVVPVDSAAGKWQDLAELLDCHKLVYLGLVYHVSGRLFEFTDADLLSIASNLPELHELWVCWTPRPELKTDDEEVGGGLLDESAITLWGLARLLQQYPKLDRIHLTSINTADIHNSASAIEKVSRKIEISAQSMIISSPSNVAMFLEGWLPNCHLKLLEPGDDADWNVQASDNNQQLVLIMSLVELLRCHRHLVDTPMAFKDLDIPDCAKSIWTLLP